MHGLLRCNIDTGVHADARGADVSLRDVTIARDGKRGYRVQVRSRTRRVDFRGSQRPDEFARYGRRTRWGADDKARIERMCISLLMSKNL